MMFASDNYFDEHNLRASIFQSSKAAYDELNKQAHLVGFELASKYAFTFPYAYFYCKKGGSVNPGRPTSKTSCPFFIRLSVVERFQSNTDIKVVEFNLRHEGHEPHPSDFAHKILPDETKEIIFQLYHSGATPTTIRQFLVERGWPLLTTIQISKIAHHDDIQNFSRQTDQLVSYMNSLNSFSEIYEETYDKTTQRIAVMIVTQDELHNLNKYDDVIFIDATITPTDLQWQLIPITLVDKYKNLACGGILFSAIINTDVVKWMLEDLLRISNLQNTLQTIISYDDQSFTPAIEEIFDTHFQDRRAEMFHVQCANQKTDNAFAKIRELKIPKEIGNNAKQLLKSICFSANKFNCQNSIEGLQMINPQLARYLQKNFIPLIPQFALSKLDNVFTLGYNTTSCAESMNHLLKRDANPKLQTLKNMRIQCCQCLVSQKIRTAIQHLIEKSNIQQAEPTSNTDEFKVSLFGFNKSNETFITKTDSCSCGLVKFEGIPCSHIMTVRRFLSQPFPIELISPRWILRNDNPEAQIPLHRFQITSRSIRTVNESDDSLVSKAIICDDIPSVDTTLESSDYSRYMELYHLGKNLANLAAKDLSKTLKVKEVLQSLINHLLFDSNNDNSQQVVQDVFDSIGLPPGRPKKINTYRK
jgi:hypothetical protein